MRVQVQSSKLTAAIHEGARERLLDALCNREAFSGFLPAEDLQREVDDCRATCSALGINAAEVEA